MIISYPTSARRERRKNHQHTTLACFLHLHLQTVLEIRFDPESAIKDGGKAGRPSVHIERYVSAAQRTDGTFPYIQAVVLFDTSTDQVTWM